MRPRHVSSTVLGPEEWLATLMRADVAVSMPLFGYRTVPEDWRVHPRTIDEHLVYFVVSNVCEGRVGKRILRLEPGTFSWIMPGTTHELWIPKGGRPFKLYFFKLNMVVPHGRWFRLQQDYIVQRHSWKLQTTMCDIIESLQMNQMYHEQYLRGLMVVLFSRVLRQRGSSGEAGSVLNDAQRRKVMQFAKQNIFSHPNPRDMAAALELSPDYFSRAFRRTFSVSPRRWLLNERIRVASVLLSRPGSSVSQIAKQTGYADVYLFSRQFKQVLGVSPRLFRAKPGL